MPHTLGSKTRSAIIYGPESHKLFLEFNFTDGEVIEQGTPVVLDATNPGAVKAAAAGELLTNIIGYAITGDGHTAYGKGLVTIACRGFMVVNGVASGDIQAGPVEFSAVASAINEFKTSTAVTKQVGWAIAPAVDTADVEVLLF